MYGNSPRANLTPLISSLLLDMEDGGGGTHASVMINDRGRVKNARILEERVMCA